MDRFLVISVTGIRQVLKLAFELLTTNTAVIKKFERVESVCFDKQLQDVCRESELSRSVKHLKQNGTISRELRKTFQDPAVFHLISELELRVFDHKCMRQESKRTKRGKPGRLQVFWPHR